jgi:hypothetical protein
MLSNAFIGKTSEPAEDELNAALGSAREIWDRVLAELKEECAGLNGEWYSYSPKAGWALRLKREKRTIAYLSPCSGAFAVSFVLGGKAIQAARESKLPARVVKAIDEARKYAEGTGVRIEVRGPRDIAGIRKLAAAKLTS